MTPTARVYRHPRSPYFQAWFLAWDSARTEWRPTTRSTRSTDEAEALGIARELERVALEASGQTGRVRVGQDWAVRAVNSLLVKAGMREVATGCPWNEYADGWLARRSKTLAAGSWRAYKSRVEVFNRWLGSKKTLPLSAFTPAMVQAYYDHLLADGRGTTTARGHIDFFQSLFERAREEGLCARNPWTLIDKAKGSTHERDAFSQGQLVRLLAHLRSSDATEEWLTVVLLGVCTGQRLGDCAGALWTQFEPPAKGRPRVWILTQRKTGARLRVPIVEPLESHMQVLETQRTGLHLAPSLAGQSVPGLCGQFRRLLAAAGIEGRKVKGQGKGKAFHSLTFHSLRHTCNSLLANAGVSGDVRRAILGHASQKMNDRYTHIEDATTGDALVQAITRAVS